MNHPFYSTRYYTDKYKLPFLWHEVLRLAGDGNYTLFLLTDGTQYLSSKTLRLYEACLPPEFLRIHKRDIINRNFVLRFCRENGCILLTDGSEVKVARRRLREVVKKIERYFFEKRKTINKNIEVCQSA